MITTPEMISAMPIRAGASIFCPKNAQPTAVMRTMPTPDHTAYAMPTGIERKVSDKK